MNVFVITLAMMLTACSGLSTDFACDKTATGTCLSVSEANRQAKKGSLPRTAVSEQPAENTGAETGAVPKRTGEKIHRIWIASYIDEEDNLHQSQVIYFSSAPSQWQVKGNEKAKK